MGKIMVLDQSTINKIAAGEVIERPSAALKELVENAIDAGANAITVEIKEGGISFLRITDNGAGITKEDIPLAFLRHSTSKIKSVEDLLSVSSLGFRGEALSSIAAVSQVELVTKTREALMGNRYVMEGGIKKVLEDVGCPNGTTFLIRNLFFNTPARKKFLKTAATEAGYCNDLMMRLAISHPEISFTFITNGQVKLNTSGNGRLKDIIYHVYGRDIASHITPVLAEGSGIAMDGFIGKPVISRGNRNYENYFINGRYIKSSIIGKAIEEAYSPYAMNHRYPFTAIHFAIDKDFIDVNVHPTKMEIRFHNGEEIYHTTYRAIKTALEQKELIPAVTLSDPKEKERKKTVLIRVPEPFEENRKRKEEKSKSVSEEPEVKGTSKMNSDYQNHSDHSVLQESTTYGTQIELFSDPLLSEEAKKQHRIIGQLFSTYWIVEFQDKMFLIDQHAAHEKVLYEHMMQMMKTSSLPSQRLLPPMIVTLTMLEEEALQQHKTALIKMGFEIDAFGGNEYAVSAVPANFYGLGEKEILLQTLDGLLSERISKTPELILEKIASFSCKAAVKGNHKMSETEAHSLIEDLLTLDNPYHCPHGRPTIISMSKYEIEKKFKRIL